MRPSNFFYYILFSLYVVVVTLKPTTKEEWLNEMKQLWYKDEIFSPQEQAIELGRPFFRGNYVTLTDDLQKLWAYNWYRSLLNKREINSLDEIDWDWLRDSVEELLTLTLIHDPKYKESYQHSSFTQKKLLSGIRDEILPGKPLALLGSKSVGVSTSRFIGLTKRHDYNAWLAIAYHEVAHILYGDSLMRSYIHKGILPATIVATDPFLINPASQTERYKELGKKILDESSDSGSKIIAFLKSGKDFFTPPADDEKKLRYMIMRMQEQRADLYEIQKLWQHGYLGALLQEITFYANLEYRINATGVSGPSNFHPSDIERALVIVGFLHEKGVDVNQTLQNWELYGTSKFSEYMSPREFYLPWPTISQGVKDAQAAYKAWQR